MLVRLVSMLTKLGPRDHGLREEPGVYSGGDDYDYDYDNGGGGEGGTGGQPMGAG